MVDIATVAAHAGVSTATVSRALNGKSASEKTRQKVLDAAAELGYVMSSSASSLASGRTRTVGFTSPFLDRWYFAEIMKGMEAELVAAGYDLLVYSPQGAEHQRGLAFPNPLRRNTIDGLVVASVDIATDEIRTLRQLGKPIVSIGGPLEGATEISIDDIAIARIATEHLLSLGHTRIGHIGTDTPPDSTFHLGRHRFEGWSSALTTAGVTPDLTLYRHADFNMQSGYHAAKSLLGINRPTAIFAASDEIAIGVLLAARDLGVHVPDELSVIGIDNHSQADFFGLTTVAQSPYTQGQQAVRLILETHAMQSQPKKLSADASLIVRNTTRQQGKAVAINAHIE